MALYYKNKYCVMRINYFIKCYWILYTYTFYDFGIDIQEENGAVSYAAFSSL